MQYPLSEKIGEPALFVGRERELKYFDNWLANIPKRLSKSRVIIARRKSGKTAFVQRIFNQLWSENGAVIPFYFEFGEIKIWFPNLAIKYYCTFASQFISFLERDSKLANNLLSLEEINEYAVSHSMTPMIRDVKFLLQRAAGGYDLMWDIACSAPHRYANFFERRFLVILDEFQYINLVYRDENCQDNPDESLPGSYNSLSESKLAPMLVTGS
ncbi:hypothetical protein QUF54_00960, partial [Candidatus Marithioploca araucensis]|nr:hypothetical protein [Candidatus Marithioploca araucensis]